jgi:hypothetical protein
MNKLGIVTYLIFAIALSGCTRTHTMITVFNEQEFAPYAKKGTSSIVGQAFQKTRGGEVRYGAGETVLLIPVTSYSKELWHASLPGNAPAPNFDARLKNYIREVTADGMGNFEFNEIPAGEYYVECSIFWEVAGPYGMEQTGGVAKKQVKVIESEKLKVILTE